MLNQLKLSILVVFKSAKMRSKIPNIACLKFTHRLCFSVRFVEFGFYVVEREHDSIDIKPYSFRLPWRLIVIKTVHQPEWLESSAREMCLRSFPWFRLIPWEVPNGTVAVTLQISQSLNLLVTHVVESVVAWGKSVCEYIGLCTPVIEIHLCWYLNPF